MSWVGFISTIFETKQDFERLFATERDIPVLLVMSDEFESPSAIDRRSLYDGRLIDRIRGRTEGEFDVSL